MDNTTTSWNGMADQWVNTWTEAGTQMWKSWFDLMGRTAQSPVSDTKPSWDDITHRFVNNQQLFLRLLKLSFNSWQELFPKIDAGGDWQQFLKNYTEQVRSQLDEFSSGATKVSQDSTELWKLYVDQTRKVSQLWADSLGSAIAPFGRASLSGATEPWIELNNLYWNLLYEETFGSLMQSPLLGPTREVNGKLLRAFDAWAKLYRASVDYQVVLANVQVQSFEELMRELISRAEKGETVKDWRQFQQLWGQVADSVFEKAFCNEENLRIRGRFLNSLNTYRIQQQALMDVWMKALNMPLRSEIDEVHKTIYELRKEVKSLKKTIAQYETQAQVTPAPAVAPVDASPPESSSVSSSTSTTPVTPVAPTDNGSAEPPTSDASTAPPDATAPAKTTRRNGKGSGKSGS
jgi:class III poly(R)-hydroxyalkanoic acid synthase PhaE subunit